MTYCLLLILLVSLLLTLPLRWIDPPITSYVIQARLSGERFQDLKASWIDYSAIPGNVILAVIAGEDQRFPNHMGIDAREIRNAIQDYQSGAELRGASTLTQQLIKNLYLWPERSYLRKGLEAWLALWTDALLSKRRIMELYLNTAQFSRAYFGIERSSQYLFNKSVQNITDYEAAYLAACLPAPSSCKPGEQSDAHSRRQDFILEHMRILGNQTVSELP